MQTTLVCQQLGWPAPNWPPLAKVASLVFPIISRDRKLSPAFLVSVLVVFATYGVWPGSRACGPEQRP
jgi:hypothetical protein